MKNEISGMKANARVESIPSLPQAEAWLTETLRHVRNTQFGQVILTIHQGEVTEVQKTEKRRFARSQKET